METVQQNGRFTLFLVNSSLYILFSMILASAGTLSQHEMLNPNFKILPLAKCFKHFICLKSDCVNFRIKY